MKKRFLGLIILLTVVIASLMASYTPEAQTRKPAVVDTEALTRMERLVAELDAAGQTNMITEVGDLASAWNMLITTREANMSIVLLEQLRSGHTNEAMAVLEKQLDDDLI